MTIKKAKYQGYLWYSDKNEPQTLNNKEFELDIDDNNNPFIIEGQLFDGIHSMSIKNVDGHYILKCYNLNELNDVQNTEHVFISHRMGGIQLRFRQLWRPEPDQNCEGMDVLQPAEFVFIGFNK